MKKTKKNGLEFYKDEDAVVYAQRYRWRIYRQGIIIGASSEGYSSLRGVVNNVKSIMMLGAIGVSYRVDNVIKEAISNYKNRKK